MELEIRDVQSSESIKIPARGLTFGRAGSKADLIVPDRTVSSKHARIYAEGSDWYLEDLRSSNGTFVEGERISSPTRLANGTRFAFCRYAYEVVGPVGGGAAASTAVLADAALGSGMDATDVNRSDGGAPITDERSRSSSGRRRRDAPSAQLNDPIGGDGGGTGMEGGFGPALAYFMANTPKAVGFYMGAVPLMLFNPFGTIRKGIEEPKFGALQTRELITYALSALFLNVILGSIGGIIVSIVHGAFAVSMIVTPVISLAVAIVSSVIFGFIWHPLVRWWVRLLKGESDEVSRSNYAIMFFTAMPILAMSALLGTIIGLIPLPFIGVVPILIAVVAQLLMTLINFKWFMHFRVMKWFPIVLLILGGLSCITAVRGAIHLIKVEIDTFGSGSSSSDPIDVGDPQEAMAAARDLDKRLASGEITAKEAGELARRAAAAAVMAANAGTAAAGATAEANQAAADAAATAAAAGSAAVVPGAGSTATPSTAVAGDTGPGTVNAPAAGTTGSVPSAGTTGGAAAGTTRPAGRPPAALRPADETPYESFLRRRAAVEAAISRDPTILIRKDVRPLYKEMHKITFKLQKKYKVKLGKKASPEKMAEKKVSEKLRQAEVFEQTTTIVDRLYRKVVESR